MKKCMAVFMGVILMINCAGCGDKHHDVYKEIHERYYNLKSYYAEAKMVVTNDRSQNEYLVRQFYKAPDMYSMVADAPEDVSGSGYVFNGKTFILKSGFGKNAILKDCSPDTKSASCLVDFFAEYYKSEETAVTVSGGLEEGTTVLDCQVSGRNPEIFSQSLWIDNKTFLPLKLETYDVDGNTTVTVEYNDFKLNCETDDSLFE